SHTIEPDWEQVAQHKLRQITLRRVAYLPGNGKVLCTRRLEIVGNGAAGTSVRMRSGQIEAAAIFPGRRRACPANWLLLLTVLKCVVAATNSGDEAGTQVQ